jgi:hypothetical protein
MEIAYACRSRFRIKIATFQERIQDVKFPVGSGYSQGLRAAFQYSTFDAAPQPAHNIFRHLETNIQSIKRLHQVNLKTQEN